MVTRELERSNQNFVKYNAWYSEQDDDVIGLVGHKELMYVFYIYDEIMKTQDEKEEKMREDWEEALEELKGRLALNFI